VLTDRLDLTLGYRYLRTEERELTDDLTGVKLDPASLHFIELGLHFRF
jgi:hypothetical protein